MSGAPVGRIVSLYYDALVEQDDVIQTGTGRCYRAVSVRVTKKGRYAGRRHHVQALVIDPSEVTADDTIRTLQWYSREKKK